MYSKEKISRLLSDEMRAYVLALLSSYFSLAYHIFAFFMFLYLKIPFMVYFNIGSIICFTASTLIISLTKKVTVPFMFGMVEAIIHQLFALYFTGASASFQYLILIVGFLPFLLLGRKIKIALPLGLISSVLFVLISIFNDSFQPHVEIEESFIYTLKSVNISCSILIILLLVMIFSLLSFFTEQKLSSQVMIQATALQSQNSRIIEIQNNTILSLSNLVENRDSDTGHHILRTREYVRLLATKASESKAFRKQLTSQYIELMIKSAPMHDIGKIVVPDAILKKPGKLSPEEFEQIKRHTTEGGKIIRDVIGHTGDKEYIKVATEISTGHHEKWDGTGYPYNLKGTEIPLSARIMALADVFDALVSPRCYKKPFTVSKAVEIINESAGTHFDPELAKIFTENKELLEEISVVYKD